VLGGDFNIVLKAREKRGGLPVLDPFLERMEDLMLEWDSVDFPPNTGKCTWSNKRNRNSHIVTRID